MMGSNMTFNNPGTQTTSIVPDQEQSIVQRKVLSLGPDEVILAIVRGR